MKICVIEWKSITMLNYIQVLPVFIYPPPSLHWGGISWELEQPFAGHESTKPRAKGRIEIDLKIPLIFWEEYNPPERSWLKDIYFLRRRLLKEAQGTNTFLKQIMDHWMMLSVCHNPLALFKSFYCEWLTDETNCFKSEAVSVLLNNIHLTRLCPNKWKQCRNLRWKH